MMAGEEKGGIGVETRSPQIISLDDTFAKGGSRGWGSGAGGLWAGRGHGCRVEEGRGGWLTCVLAELVHGLQVDDVGGQPAVHLAQHHAAPRAGTGTDHRLDVMAHGRAVGTPAAVLVQPFPDHHGRGQEHGEPGAAAVALPLHWPLPGPAVPAALLLFLLRRRLRASAAPPAPRPNAPGSLSSGPWAPRQPLMHRDPDTGASAASGLGPCNAAIWLRRCCRCSGGSCGFMQKAPHLAKPCKKKAFCKVLARRGAASSPDTRAPVAPRILQAPGWIGGWDRDAPARSGRHATRGSPPFFSLPFPSVPSLSSLPPRARLDVCHCLAESSLSLRLSTLAQLNRFSPAGCRGKPAPTGGSPSAQKWKSAPPWHGMEWHNKAGCSRQAPR